jgi:hypothetical protein
MGSVRLARIAGNHTAASATTSSNAERQCSERCTGEARRSNEHAGGVPQVVEKAVHSKRINCALAFRLQR